MKEDSVALSIVATSRNDNHGNLLQERTQWFIDSIAFGASHANFKTELIIVEWNPPHDKLSLAQTLNFPKNISNLICKIITVPSSVHSEILGENSNKLPMMQMIAKNVGIKRAVGRNILSTNIDILFPLETFSFCGSFLKEYQLVRTDRLDVRFPFDKSVQNVESALNVCPENIIRIIKSDGIYYPNSGRTNPRYKSLSDILIFQSKQLVDKISVKQNSIRSEKQTQNVNWNKNKPSSVLIADKLQALYSIARFPLLHENACGDFTLMTNTAWNQLKGYPEWPMFSWNIDSVILIQAYSFSYEMIDLSEPKIIYHMEHSEGSGWTPEGHSKLFTNLETLELKYFTNSDLRSYRLKYMHKNKNLVINDDNWGLATADLPMLIP